MKKFFALAIAVVMVSVLAFTAAADFTSEPVSCDQVFVYGEDGSTRIDLAKFGGNDQSDTELGDITGKIDGSFHIFGWHAASQKIVEFGYRYGDDVTLGSPKADTEDAVVAAGSSVAGDTGESVRFNIEVPAKTGEDVEVFAVVKYADGTVADIWRVVYSYGSSAPAEPDADTWLCKAGGSVATGWWMNPFTDQDWEINFKFTTPNAFDGFASTLFANPEGATVKISVLDASGAVLDTVEHTQMGDGLANIKFNKAFAPGTYTIQFKSTDNGAHFVVGSSEAGDIAVEVSGNGNTNENTLAAPIILLTGAVNPGGQSGGKTNPKTADASVIAIAAVAVAALAGVVVAKKIK